MTVSQHSESTRLAQLEQRVQALEDVNAIRHLKARYAAYCDDQYNPDGIAALFTEDAVWESQGLGRFEGRDAIREFFRGGVPHSSFPLRSTTASMGRLTCRATRPGRNGISSCPARSARTTGPCGGQASIMRSTCGWQGSGSSRAKPLHRSFTRPLQKGGPRRGSCEGRCSPPDRLVVLPGRSTLAGLWSSPHSSARPGRRLRGLQRFFQAWGVAKVNFLAK